MVEYILVFFCFEGKKYSFWDFYRFVFTFTRMILVLVCLRCWNVSVMFCGSAQLWLWFNRKQLLHTWNDTGKCEICRLRVSSSAASRGLSKYWEGIGYTNIDIISCFSSLRFLTSTTDSYD